MCSASKDFDVTGKFPEVIEDASSPSVIENHSDSSRVFCSVQSYLGDSSNIVWEMLQQRGDLVRKIGIVPTFCASTKARKRICEKHPFPFSVEVLDDGEKIQNFC
jgi:hypothetical protein